MIPFTANVDELAPDVAMLLLDTFDWVGCIMDGDIGCLGDCFFFVLRNQFGWIYPFFVGVVIA
jgi:hypothetical protein